MDELRQLEIAVEALDGRQSNLVLDILDDGMLAGPGDERLRDWNAATDVIDALKQLVKKHMKDNGW